MQGPELEEGDEEWEVEDILAKRRRNREDQYLVKWKGWPAEYNQWEPASHLQHAPALVRKYEKTARRTTSG